MAAFFDRATVTVAPTDAPAVITHYASMRGVSAQVSSVWTMLADKFKPLEDKKDGGFIGWVAWQAGHAYDGTDQITPETWQQYYAPNIQPK